MKKVAKWLSILTVSSLLVACQAEPAEEKEEVADVQASTVEKKEAHMHDHDHADDEVAKKIYAGHFEDSQIQARELTDWAGDWQSVYPYLLDGTLDEVFAHKVANGGKMTEDEYKEYYDIGYKTTVNRLVMDGDQVTFYENGQALTGTYVSDGYEVLTYEAGNRGVRYSYKLAEPVEGLPSYIQFSDHSISPTDAGHYHLYWGDDRAALLEEVVHWPTYYPSNLDGHTIAHEMMVH